jgi:hypothetical protein
MAAPLNRLGTLQIREAGDLRTALEAAGGVLPQRRMAMEAVGGGLPLRRTAGVAVGEPTLLGLLAVVLLLITVR